MKKKFLAICAVLALTAGLTFAATITQTQTFSGIPNMNGSLTFNQFDSSLGTLTSIQVRLSLQTSGGRLILDNDSASSASGTFEFGANGSIGSTDVSLMDTSLQPITDLTEAFYSQAFSLDANVDDVSGDYDPASPDGLQYDGGIVSDTASGLVDSTVWGGYTGTGTYNINYNITQWLDYGGISGIECAITPVSASGDVTVIYTYIPEPATMLLLAIGAVAILRKK